MPLTPVQGHVLLSQTFTNTICVGMNDVTSLWLPPVLLSLHDVLTRQTGTNRLLCPRLMTANVSSHTGSRPMWLPITPRGLPWPWPVTHLPVFLFIVSHLLYIHNETSLFFCINLSQFCRCCDDDLDLDGSMGRLDLYLMRSVCTPIYSPPPLPWRHPAEAVV